jgi:predicted dehydrogenase
LRIVVFGCGSIGSRHAKNIAQIGEHDLVLYDPDASRANQLSSETGAQVATTIDEALASSPDAALICTPPDTHVEATRRALESGANCFVEKPLATDYKQALEITELAEQNNLTLMVGFNLRFHPGLIKLQQLVTDGTLGRIMMIRAEYGQYLPDWRPNADYRTNYITGNNSGGGIIREESHEADYVQWLGGDIDDVYVAAGKLSDLDMTAEDSALMVMRLSSGALAEVHVDCVQQGYSRKCKVIGTNATAEWVYETGITLTGGPEAKDAETFDTSPDTNTMYLDEITHFLECCKGNATPPVDGRSALATMQVINAARRSMASRKAEPIQ